MASIRFVADSTADLKPEYVKKHGIELVPLKVIFGEEEFRDYFDITPDALYKRMKSDTVHPRTSQPSPAEFEQAFRAASDDGSTVICTTISSELSGTWNSATAARQTLSDRDIRVIDTRTATIAHSEILHAAVACAERGDNADKVVERIEALKKSSRLVFTVETLEYLKRGGRIGGAQAMLGTLLSIKPILGVVDGRVEPIDKVRTFSKAIDRLLVELDKSARNGALPLRPSSGMPPIPKPQFHSPSEPRHPLVAKFLLSPSARSSACMADPAPLGSVSSIPVDSWSDDQLISCQGPSVRHGEVS